MKKIFIATLTLALITMLSAACTQETKQNASPLPVNDRRDNVSAQSDSPAETEVNAGTSIIWFSENGDNSGVFWLGMTLDESLSAIAANGLKTRQVYPYETDKYDGDVYVCALNAKDYYEINCMSNINFVFSENKILQTFYFGPLYTPQFPEDRELEDLFLTERGLKRGDSVERLQELYGEFSYFDDNAPRRSSDPDYRYKLNDKLYMLILATDQVDTIIYSAFPNY